MADELTECVKYEIEGVKMLFQGSVKVAAWIKQFITFLIRELTEEPGESSVKQLFRLGKDVNQVPVTLNIDLKQLSVSEEQFEVMLGNRGVRYHKLPVGGDGDKITYMIAPQDIENAKNLFKECKKPVAGEQELNFYNQQIAEINEKLFSTTDVKEKVKLENEKEMYQQARDELKNFLEQGKANPIKPLDEFVLGYKGTDMEKHPYRTVRLFCDSQVMESSEKIKDMLQPIRDVRAFPSTGEHFYLPETGAVIERKYVLDEETKLGHSEYFIYLPNNDGKIKDVTPVSFSDIGQTKEMWNSKTLPELLKAAGCTEDTLCQAFTKKENLQDWMKIRNKSVEFVHQKNFSSAEAMTAVHNAAKEAVKGQAFAEINQLEEMIITVDQNRSKLFTDNGKFNIKLENGDILELSNTLKHGIDKQTGKLYVSINKESDVICKRNGSEQKLSFMETKDLINSVRDKSLHQHEEQIKQSYGKTK